MEWWWDVVVLLVLDEFFSLVFEDLRYAEEVDVVDWCAD